MTEGSYIVVFSTSLKADGFQLWRDFHKRFQEVLEKRSVGGVQLCEVVLMDVRREVGVCDRCANLATRLDQLFGVFCVIQSNEFDPWVFHQRLERRARCYDDIAPFLLRGVACKVLDYRRAGDAVSTGDESDLGSHGWESI
jgi:hypothetical protein